MEPPPPIQVSDTVRWSLVLHAGLMALVALRLAFVSVPAVWIDEAFSLYHVKNGLAFLWGTGWQLETNPPLYYTVLWAWTLAFGGAEWVARLLSVVLFALATWFVHRGATALAGRTAGLAAAWLLACQPLAFQYSLEIRPYALMLLLVAFVVAALAQVLATLERRNEKDSLIPWRAVVSIVLGCTLIAYTHSIGPIIIAAVSGAAILYGLNRRQPRGYWLVWGAANALVLVCIVPQLASTLAVFKSNPLGLAWYPAPSDTTTSETSWLYICIRALFVGMHTYGVPTTKLLAAITSGLLAWSAWRMRSRMDVLTIGVATPLIGLALLFGVSFVQPILLPRTALWLIVPMCMLAGAALADVRWRSVWARSSACIVTVLAVHMCIADIDGRTYWRPWPEVVAQHTRNYRAGDVFVAVDPETLCVFDFYATGPLRSAARRILDRGSGQQWRSGQRIAIRCNEAPAIGSDGIARTIAGGAGVWLIGWDPLQTPDVDAVVAELADSSQVTERIVMDGRTIALRLAAR
jgi:hypothetical protein